MKSLMVLALCLTAVLAEPQLDDPVYYAQSVETAPKGFAVKVENFDEKTQQDDIYGLSESSDGTSEDSCTSSSSSHDSNTVAEPAGSRSSLISSTFHQTERVSFRKVQEIHKIVRRDAYSDSSHQTSTILNFWRNQENKFHLNDEIDVVLSMGNTGSGKSTILSALLGANLTSTKVGNYFAIVDERDRIGRNSSSKTLVPELIIDKNNNVAYYDCPGFLDNRNIEHEITITYFLKKLLNHISSVKFLLSVDYSSVQNTGNKNDFRDLVKQVTRLIKNIDKFRDGIAIVVTKVDNQFEIDDEGRASMVNNDNETLEGISNYLIETKMSFQNSLNESNDFYDFYDQGIKFIDTLLEKQNDSYTRIGILRKPYRNGQWNKIPSVQKEIATINTIVTENLRYVRKGSDDFSYSISDRSKNAIRKITDNLVRNRLTADISNIANEILEYYLQQQKQFNDLDILLNKFSSGHKALSIIDADEPFMFFKKYVNTTEALGVRLSVDNLKILSNNTEILDFLTTTYDEYMPDSLVLVNTLIKNITRLEESRVWYDFLINLQQKLSEFDSQKMKDDYRTKTLLQQCSMLNDNEQLNIVDIELKDFLKEIKSLSSYSNVEKLQVNAFELRNLETVLIDFSSRLDSSCSADKLIAGGYNVKLSDVIKINCWSDAKYIEISALNRIFIDSDIEKTGKELRLSIIAPTWEIIDQRKFILNGKAGAAHNESQARNGVAKSESGRDGLAGFPGGSAGHLLGIGKEFIRDTSLEIQANGGAGGAGQNGGHGTHGVKGDDPTDLHTSESFSSYEGVTKLFTNAGFEFAKGYGYYRVKGKRGVKPGNGGNGGKAGIGGEAGAVFFIGLQQRPNFSISSSTGREW